MSEEKIVRVGTGVMIFKDGKVLLGKRKAKLGFGKWCFPGGHLEFGETFKENAIRETKEETNLNIIPKRIISLNNGMLDDRHYVTIGMLGEIKSGEVKLTEPDKCERWDWFSLNDLPEPMLEETIEVIKQYKEGNINDKL